MTPAAKGPFEVKKAGLEHVGVKDAEVFDLVTNSEIIEKENKMYKIYQFGFRD